MHLSPAVTSFGLTAYATAVITSACHSTPKAFLSLVHAYEGSPADTSRTAVGRIDRGPVATHGRSRPAVKPHQAVSEMGSKTFHQDIVSIP